MSDKAYCPACESCTSAVLRGFEEEGHCPYCGLAREIAELIEEARACKVSDDILTRYAQAEQRAVAAEAQVARLRAVLDSLVRNANAALAERASIDR